MCDAVDIAIITGMGNARNNINVLSSHVVIACGMGAGTAAEVALAVKAGKPVILLTDDSLSKLFFERMTVDGFKVVESPENAIAIVKAYL